MAGRRLVLKEGFFVEGREVKGCHYCAINTADMWGPATRGILVLIDGVVQLCGEHTNDLFVDQSAAVAEAHVRKSKDLKYCKEQLEYYQRRLKELSDEP